MTKNKKLILALVVLLVAAAALALGYHTLKPQTQPGAKTLSVTVVHGDGAQKQVSIHTDEEYLGPALTACDELGVEGENGPYGLFIQTVDGETVSGNQWWCITRSGEEVTTGADLTPIADGESYELTLATY